MDTIEYQRCQTCRQWLETPRGGVERGAPEAAQFPTLARGPTQFGRTSSTARIQTVTAFSALVEEHNHCRMSVFEADNSRGLRATDNGITPISLPHRRPGPLAWTAGRRASVAEEEKPGPISSCARYLDGRGRARHPAGILGGEQPPCATASTNIHRSSFSQSTREASRGGHIEAAGGPVLRKAFPPCVDACRTRERHPAEVA